MSEQRGLVATQEVWDESQFMQVAYQRFGEIENLKKIQAQLVEDLEKSLNLIVAYQRCLRILRSPDPNYVEARRILTKYKMVGIEPSGEFKVFADGVDITTHPDSIEATAVDEPILSRSVAVESEVVTLQVGALEYPEDKEWENDQGTETAELFTDENGNLRLRPVGKKESVKVITVEEDYTDMEGEVDPSTRSWLTEEDDEPNN